MGSTAAKSRTIFPRYANLESTASATSATPIPKPNWRLRSIATVVIPSNKPLQPVVYSTADAADTRAIQFFLRSATAAVPIYVQSLKSRKPLLEIVEKPNVYTDQSCELKSIRRVNIATATAISAAVRYSTTADA
jgi:hypothetical protein